MTILDLLENYDGDSFVQVIDENNNELLFTNVKEAISDKGWDKVKSWSTSSLYGGCIHIKTTLND